MGVDGCGWVWRGNGWWKCGGEMKWEDETTRKRQASKTLTFPSPYTPHFSPFQTQFHPVCFPPSFLSLPYPPYLTTPPLPPLSYHPSLTILPSPLRHAAAAERSKKDWMLQTLPRPEGGQEDLANHHYRRVHQVLLGQEDALRWHEDEAG